MPETLYVRVSQTREVVVSANSLDDAVIIAKAAFNNTDIPKVGDKQLFGRTTTKVKETKLSAEVE